MKNTAIIHCSDSEFGNYQLINQWHKQRFTPWVDKNSGTPIYCGYHFIILNGYQYDYTFTHLEPHLDGTIQVGRPIYASGVHCKGHNVINQLPTIGICLIGSSGKFSTKQLNALNALLYKLEPSNVFQHSELEPSKAFCPGMTDDEFEDVKLHF